MNKTANESECELFFGFGYGDEDIRGGIISPDSESDYED
jgi:hypothetical protein